MHDDIICSKFIFKPHLHELFSNLCHLYALLHRYSFHLCCFGNSIMTKFTSFHFESEAWWWNKPVDINMHNLRLLILSLIIPDHPFQRYPHLTTRLQYQLWLLGSNYLLYNIHVRDITKYFFKFRQVNKAFKTMKTANCLLGFQDKIQSTFYEGVLCFKV